MTSDSTLFPQRFTKIDELTRGDHSYLAVDDECLFIGDYSARKGFSHSATNNLILNFKKPMSHRGKPGWHYKGRAIREVTRVFSQNLGGALSRLTLVPVPPSKLSNDPDYDNRLMEMLNSLSTGTVAHADVRELVIQTKAMPASHGSDNRLPPSEWEKAYAIDENVSMPKPNWIGIVDDLLVTGCRFRAMSNVIKTRFPECRVTGLFIARRIPEAINWSEFEIEL